MKKYITMAVIMACLCMAMIPVRAYQVLQCDHWRSGSDYV